MKKIHRSTLRFFYRKFRDFFWQKKVNPYLPTSEHQFTWYILSKDRPLQLDALLRSMKQHVGRENTCKVLYRCSSQSYQDAYIEVFNRHQDLDLDVKLENNFTQDLIAGVAHIKSNYFAFLVDDLVFTAPVDIRKILAIDPVWATYSFRLGRRITRCQPTGDQFSGCPPYIKIPDLPEEWLAWYWSEGNGDWSCRNSLDGNVFTQQTVSDILNRNQDFKGPQSLEKVLISSKIGPPFGICGLEPQLINLAINRVSSEEIMYPHGTVDSDLLLDAWKSGLQTDLKLINQMTPDSCHYLCDLPLEPRTDD